MRQVRGHLPHGGQMGVYIPFPNMHLLQERISEPVWSKKPWSGTLMDQLDTPAQDTYNLPEALSCFYW